MEGNTPAAYTLVSAAEVFQDPEAIPGLTGMEVSRGGGDNAGTSSLSFTAPVSSLVSLAPASTAEEEGGAGGGERGGGGELNLVYARGSSPTLGYHGRNKACFKIG